MAIPPAACSVNCGAGDVVPPFLKMYVPISFWPYSEYFSGKLFEYDSEDVPNARCLWKPVNPSPFWQLELVSRYPEGWNFPFTQPVPGKWTWRFSLDHVSVPITLLNGWSADFDRFPVLPDPNNNCTVDNTLQNYIPLTIRPDVLLEPIYDVTPPEPIGQKTSPCYCSEDCPLGTRPHRAYLVRSDDVTCQSGYSSGKLYRVVAFDHGGCAFQPTETHTPPASGNLDKRDAITTTGDHAYKWILVIADGLGCVETFTVNKEWNDDNTPNPKFGALCNGSFTLEIAFTGKTATITPVPWSICSDQAAQDWVTDRES